MPKEKQSAPRSTEVRIMGLALSSFTKSVAGKNSWQKSLFLNPALWPHHQ